MAEIPPSEVQNLAARPHPSFDLDSAIRFTTTLHDVVSRGPQAEQLAIRTSFWLNFHNELDQRVDDGEMERSQANAIRAKFDALRDINQLYDPLTNLLTKEAISEFLKMRLEEAQRNGKPLSVVMADVDRFKDINDTKGHPVGDEVLVGMARNLQKTLKTSLLGRFGGDEFLVLFPGKTKEEVIEIMGGAETGMTESMQPIRQKHGIQREIKMSYGFIDIEPTDRFEDVIKKADEKMYAKKREGQQSTQSTK